MTYNVSSGTLSLYTTTVIPSNFNTYFMHVISGGRPSSAQSHQRLNGSASGSRSLQDMQTELLRRTYRGVTAQSDESFSGLDAQQRATMPYSSTSHYLRQAHGFEKPKSAADPPPSGLCCIIDHLQSGIVQSCGRVHKILLLY